MSAQEDRKEAARQVLRRAIEVAPDTPADMLDLLAVIGGPRLSVQKLGGANNVSDYLDNDQGSLSL